MIIKAGNDKLNELDNDILRIHHAVFCDCCESEIFTVSFGLSKKDGITSSYLDEIPFRKSTYYTLKSLADIILERPFIEKNVMMINDKHICRNCWNLKSGDGEFMDKVKRILKIIRVKEKDENN